MDLRSLCSKLDVDAIRAKIPPLPQIKLPKSMSKITKSRKIFRSSREDVNSIRRSASSKRIPPSKSGNLALSSVPSYSIPPAEFINRTPTRISTISSLMNQRDGGGAGAAGGGSTKWKIKNDEENSYRSAGGIDDYYPSPLTQRFEQRLSRPISPVRAPPIAHDLQAQSEQNIKMSFVEKIQKGYKDATEFKLKHMFAKKTVVHRDNIEVDHYVHRYNEDRKKEERRQNKLDRDIADNYKFQFKVSKQDSDESYGNSPTDSPPQTAMPKKTQKAVSSLTVESDESGMESSPPKRKSGIAATRFAKVRSIPLNMSLERDDDNDNVGGGGGGKQESFAASTTFSKVQSTSLSMSLEEDDDDDDDGGGGAGKKESTNKHTRISKVRGTSLSTSLEDDDDDGKQKVIAANARVSKVQATPISMSLEEDEDDDDDGAGSIDLDEQEVLDTPKIKPNTSSLYEIKQKKSPEKVGDPHHQKPKTFKECIVRLTSKLKEVDETKNATEKKRKAPLSPQQSEEKDADDSIPTAKSDKPFDAIKHNFKRLQKSMKLPQQQTGVVESENETEANSDAKSKLTKTQQFTERIKRFRSTDNVDKIPEDEETTESPIHKITHKLQEWKKSFKKKPDSHNTDNDDNDYEAATSPQKRDKPVGALMKKLKHIRTRKQESTDDPDEDEEGGDTYKESLTARAKLQLEKGVAAASLVPQRTIKKINDTKKYFKKKQETEGQNKAEKSKSDEEDEEDVVEETTFKPVTAKSMPRPPPPIPRPYYKDTFDVEDSGDEEEFIRKSIAESKQIAVPTARTVWTTKPILSDADTTDYDDELPTVLIHQDNSDVFESTLIIAVTRPRSHTSTPIITELPPDSTEESTPDTKSDNWVPSKTTNLERTPPPPQRRKLSRDSNTTNSSQGHSRKHSIDSSSDDSWFKDIPRGPSIAVLNSVHENEEPWRIHGGRKREENLYKTKSIDLFELQKKHGGVLTAFEDFDDQLKNTPVVKIEKQAPKIVEIRQNIDNYERESSEEFEYPDDDNSSRITKISLHCNNAKKDTKEEYLVPELKSQAYGNSRESLTGNLDDKDAIVSDEPDDMDDSEDDDDNDEYEDDEDEDRPPSKAPSPPPSISPPPLPPLPQRQPSIRLSKLKQLSIEDTAQPPVQPPPPLPQTKPPIPPNRPTQTPPPPKIPERNVATTRISKPLVKTASLRLAYSEQVNPQDVGKVNKLISRFEHEGPKQRPRIIPRKPLLTNESEEYSEEEEEDSIKMESPIRQKKARDLTPTNQPRMQKSFSIDSADIPNNNNKTLPLHCKATSQIAFDNTSSSAMSIPTISISSSCADVNSNFSQPNSVYGSPLAFPSSLVGSAEVTPLTTRRESEYLVTRRNRRSMARDDENFYSFDSDEENSYYSISSTSSNRYVIEL